MSPGASEGEAETEVTQTEVARTASRGLFRRRPERPARPAARPPQRRVAELIAEAERDRVAPRPDPAERSAGPARPGRPGPGADDPGRGPHGRSRASAAGGARVRPPRAQVGGRQRGLPEQRVRSPRAHARRVRDAARRRRRRRSPHRVHPERGGIRDERFGERGVVLGERGRVRPVARGAGRPRRPARPRGRPPPAGQRQVRQRHARERWVRERCVRRRCDMPTVRMPTVRIDGAYRRGYQDDSSPPAWPSLGAYGYDRPFGPDREPGAGREFAADRDHVAGAGSDPDLWIEATVWASVVGSGAAPGVEAADVGADDWTVPMPVVRAAPEPEPEPVRPAPSRTDPGAHDPGAAAAQQACPSGRRGAGRRVAGLDAPAGDPRAVAAGASAGRAAAVAVGRVRMGGRRDVGPWGTGPGRARLGPAPARRPPCGRTR